MNFELHQLLNFKVCPCVVDPGRAVVQALDMALLVHPMAV